MESREQVLLTKAKSGDKSALKEIYLQNAGYLYAVCSRYISDREEVNDIIQDSFIKILSSLDKFEYRRDGGLRSWMSRIVTNASLKRLRLEKGKLELLDQMPEDIPEEDVDVGNISQETLLSMISSLPDGYKAVFNLYVFEKMSHKEIASLLGISENTSASQLHHAKARLQKLIIDYNRTNNE